ncbi:hypothetical protein GQ457_07G007330 [Hibiscus cannabinus]
MINQADLSPAVLWSCTEAAQSAKAQKASKQNITSLVEARKQEDQGLNHLFNLEHVAARFFCIFGLEYWYSSVVSVPKFNTGIRVSVLLDEYRYPFEIM